MPSSNVSPSESQWQHHRVLSTAYGPVLYTGLLLTLGVSQAVVRYLRIAVGHIEPHPDVRTAWETVGREVLSGTPLYLGAATDNKPPLFEYLNVAVASTDAYLANFLLLVGVANACIGLLLWRLAVADGRPLVGAYAGLLYVLAAPLALGDAVNVRTFSLLLVLASVFVHRTDVSGGLAGAATLVSQYALLVLPAAALCRARSEGPRAVIRWLVRYGVTLGSVVAVGFLSVYALWGSAAFVASVRRAVFSAGQYVVEWGPSLWTGSGLWLSMHLATVAKLVVVLGFAAVGGVTVCRRLRGGSAETGDARTLCFVLLFSLPLVVRSFPTYWLYPLPWLSVLAVDGMVTVREQVVGRAVE